MNELQRKFREEASLLLPSVVETLKETLETGLTNQRLKACQMILDKTIPSLSSVNVSSSQPVIINFLSPVEQARFRLEQDKQPSGEQNRPALDVIQARVLALTTPPPQDVIQALPSSVVPQPPQNGQPTS